MSIVFIKQHDSMQCGVACLQMICEYYHKKYSTNYLSSLCNTTTEGVSMLSIRDTAFALGLESSCGKVNIKGIKKISSHAFSTGIKTTLWCCIRLRKVRPSTSLTQEKDL